MLSSTETILDGYAGQFRYKADWEKAVSFVMAAIAILPLKWRAGSSRVTAELTFYGGGSEGERR